MIFDERSFVDDTVLLANDCKTTDGRGSMHVAFEPGDLVHGVCEIRDGTRIEEMIGAKKGDGVLEILSAPGRDQSQELYGVH